MCREVTWQTELRQLTCFSTVNSQTTSLPLDHCPSSDLRPSPPDDGTTSLYLSSLCPFNLLSSLHLCDPSGAPYCLETGFKILIWPYLFLCCFSCAHSICLHLPSSSWSLGILFLLPRMSSSPISAPGKYKLNRGPPPSGSLPTTIQSLASPVSILYQTVLSGAHLPRPVGSSLQHHQLRVSTPDSLLPCAGH